MTSQDQIVTSAMQIIIKAGDGRADTYRAIGAIQEGDFAQAMDLVGSADESITAAHMIHTDLIQAEAGGEEIGYSMLFTHAQDTLMTAYSEFRLVKKLVPVMKSFHDRLSALEETK